MQRTATAAGFADATLLNSRDDRGRSGVTKINCEV
jgi:hypothetical protein